MSAPAPPTLLHGRSRGIAQALWVAVVVPTIGFSAWGFSVGLRHPELVGPREVYPALRAIGLDPRGGVLFILLPTMIYMTLVALFLFWRRPHDWLVLLSSVVFVTQGASISRQLLVLEQVHPRTILPARVVMDVALVSALALIVLFPDGRLAPRWTIVVPAGAFIAVLGLPDFIGFLFRYGELRASYPPWRAWFILSLFAALVLGGTVANLVRYPRMGKVERLQVRWVTFGFGVYVFMLLQGLVVPLALPRYGAAWLGWSALLSSTLGLAIFQIAFVVAIIRYRLYDIDRIISRTVSYAIVTALLGGVFALFVVVPSLLLGSRNVPDFVIAAATLVVAALFGPVRRRVQKAVDHRFNRSRYDAARTIDSFTARMRDEVDIDALGTELQEVVGKTMQPAHVSIWLR